MKIHGMLCAVMIFLFASAGALRAEAPAPVRGNALILADFRNSARTDLITAESLRMVNRVCMDLGRFLPVEKNLLDHALEQIGGEGGDRNYESLARSLKVSLCMIISVQARGNEFTGSLKVIAIDPYCRFLERDVTVRSGIPANIPCMLALEAARTHSRVPLRALIMKSGDEEFLLEAGQWHGLEEKSYLTDRGLLTVEAAGRYRSRVSIKAPFNDGDSVILNIYPPTEKIIREFSDRIEMNTLKRYAMDPAQIRGDSPESRFISGTCVINPGANVCLPIYGSFLATEHMGFRNAKFHAPGFMAGSTAFAGQLLFTEFLTGFSTNFFPWIRDSDKDAGTHRLQRFLWCSIPLTFTAAYFDQLAWQMKQSRVLPAFFMYRNQFAASLSLLFPGGGLMYKGHLMEGWGYYYAEMALAGYGFYNFHERSGARAFMALGALKAIEMIHAFFASPDFSFYRMERGQTGGELSFFMGFAPVGDDENVMRLGVTSGF
jgi:hypothetical protein